MPAVSNAVGAEGEGSEGEGSEGEGSAGERGGPEERWSQDDHRLPAAASDPDTPGWPLGVSASARGDGPAPRCSMSPSAADRSAAGGYGRQSPSSQPRVSHSSQPLVADSAAYGGYVDPGWESCRDNGGDAVEPGYLEPGYSMRDTYVTTVEEPYLESCGYNSGDAVDPGMMMVGYQAKDPDCASDAWVVQTPVTGGAGVAGTLGVLLQAL